MKYRLIVFAIPNPDDDPKDYTDPLSVTTHPSLENLLSHFTELYSHYGSRYLRTEIIPVCPFCDRTMDSCECAER